MSQLTTPLTSNQTETAELRASKEGYVHRVLVAFDIFDNVAFLGGKEDETISSHAERAAIKGDFLAKVLSRGLDFIQKQHGQKASAGDLARAQAIVKTEETAGTVTAISNSTTVVTTEDKSGAV